MKPIHGLIATFVYNIEVTGAADILFYGGPNRLDNGSAAFTVHHRSYIQASIFSHAMHDMHASPTYGHAT
jgi:hypothetical protein